MYFLFNCNVGCIFCLFVIFGNKNTDSAAFRDNYGFVTFAYTCDAYAAIESK